MSEIFQIISDSLQESLGFPDNQRVLLAINSVQDHYSALDFFKVMALVYQHPDAPHMPETMTHKAA